MKDERLKGDFLSSSLKEQGFKLPLPTLVEGTDIRGLHFKENTVLSYISHSGSSFWLHSLVAVGSELKLTSNLPASLSGDRDLKLIIRGKVIFVESADSKNTKNRVSLKFDSKYLIKENA